MRLIAIIASVFIILFSQSSIGDSFPMNTPYELCFTPQDNCTKLLVNHINAAKHRINAQIYSFTSYKIAHALAQAVKRGVNVTVIFDHSNFKKRYFSFAPYLKKRGISCYIDEGVKSIAHNKVMVLDQDWIETGSFNYTKAAQTKNAENMLLIQSKQLNQQYEKNFKRRLGESKHC